MCGCNNSTTTVTNNTVNRTVNKCPELYEVLRGLDLRVLDLLTVSPTPILLDTNRQLRLWMRNLNSHCPTSEDIETVTSFIDSEEVRVKN